MRHQHDKYVVLFIKDIRHLQGLLQHGHYGYDIVGGPGEDKSHCDHNDHPCNLCNKTTFYHNTENTLDAHVNCIIQNNH